MQAIVLWNVMWEWNDIGRSKGYKGLDTCTE